MRDRRPGTGKARSNMHNEVAMGSGANRERNSSLSGILRWKKRKIKRPQTSKEFVNKSGG